MNIACYICTNTMPTHYLPSDVYREICKAAKHFSLQVVELLGITELILS